MDTPSNNELQHYLPPHAVIDGNEIEITAVETEMGYESAMLVSSLCFQYCNITFRIDSLEGAGLFPAI